MEIEIKYCGIWNYKPEALRVREQLIGSGYTVQLVEGTGGVFDIVVDNQLKFSKKINGNFPSEKEISSIISGF